MSAKKPKNNLSYLVDYIGQLDMEIKAKQTLLDINKNTLINEMKKVQSSSDYVDGENFYVKLVTRTDINYDAYKLDKKMDKLLTNKFINKEYFIYDYEGFVKKLKKLGIKFSDVKEYLQVNKKIERSELEKLVESKIIGIEDLKNCYTVSQSKYIKINKKKE